MPVLPAQYGIGLIRFNGRLLNVLKTGALMFLKMHSVERWMLVRL